MQIKTSHISTAFSVVWKGQNMKYQNLFTPYRIGSVEIRNRFAMAPMGPLGLGDSEDGWNQRGIDDYTRRAQGALFSQLSQQYLQSGAVRPHQP